jgi:hypothetical protein
MKILFLLGLIFVSVTGFAGEGTPGQKSSSPLPFFVEQLAMKYPEEAPRKVRPQPEPS